MNKKQVFDPSMPGLKHSGVTYGEEEWSQMRALPIDGCKDGKSGLIHNESEAKGSTSQRFSRSHRVLDVSKISSGDFLPKAVRAAVCHLGILHIERPGREEILAPDSGAP